MQTMLIVQTTFDDREEALRLAREAIRRRLAACAQLTENVTSIYWWENAVEESGECVLSLKTVTQKYKTLEQFILETHSYDTPEIIALAVEEVAEGYHKWLLEEIG